METEAKQVYITKIKSRPLDNLRINYRLKMFLKLMVGK